MVNVELLTIFFSIAVGGGLTLLLFIPKEERGRQLDHWIGITIMFLLGYKLLPLLFTPSLIFKPIQWLVLKSGDLGLMLGFLFSLLYLLYKLLHDRKHMRMVYNSLVITLSASYTIYSIIAFEVYAGHYIAVYRFLLGITFLLFVWFKQQRVQTFLPLYGGVLLIVESIPFAHLYWGLALVQWLIVFVILFHFIIHVLQREEG